MRWSFSNQRWKNCFKKRRKINENILIDSYSFWYFEYFDISILSFPDFFVSILVAFFAIFHPLKLSQKWNKNEIILKFLLFTFHVTLFFLKLLSESIIFAPATFTVHLSSFKPSSVLTAKQSFFTTTTTTKVLRFTWTNSSEKFKLIIIISFQTQFSNFYIFYLFSMNLSCEIVYAILDTLLSSSFYICVILCPPFSTLFKTM